MPEGVLLDKLIFIVVLFAKITFFEIVVNRRTVKIACQ